MRMLSGWPCGTGQGAIQGAGHGRPGTGQFHELRKPQPALLHRGVERIRRFARRQHIQEPFNARVERHGDLRRR